MFASAVRPERLARALRLRTDLRKQIVQMCLTVGILMAVGVATTGVGGAGGRRLTAETGNGTVIETDSGSDSVQTETDPFAGLPHHWYTFVPVLNALFLDPRAPWWCFALVMLTSVLFFMGMHFLVKSKCGGDSKWVRIMDCRGLVDLSIALYGAGLLLTYYHVNIAIALAANVAMSVMQSGVLMRLLKLSLPGNASELVSEVEGNSRLVELENNAAKKETVDASNVYQNIHFGSSKVVATFFLQVAFAYLYLSSLCKADVTDVNEMFYYGAVVLQIPITLSTMNTIDVTEETWATLRKWAKDGKVLNPPVLTSQDFQQAPAEDGSPPPPPPGVKVSLLEMGLRMAMGSVVNQAGPNIIMSTLPLFLSLSDSPMDFVMNSMAITFIVELDNLSDNVEISVKKDGTD
jgi:hypothetical protein